MQRVIDTVLNRGSDFGRGERNHLQWMVEFSQPNTHKAFHVGHLRSAILGDVLARILDFAGLRCHSGQLSGRYGSTRDQMVVELS